MFDHPLGPIGRPMRGKTNSIKNRNALSANFDPGMDRIPKVTPIQIQRARLRLVESAIRNDVPLEDIEEVLSIVGDVTATGAIVNLEKG